MPIHLLRRPSAATARRSRLPGAHHGQLSPTDHPFRSAHPGPSITLYALALFLLVGSLPHAHALPDLISYSFSPATSKLLPGSSDSCSGPLASEDQIGDLALVARPYHLDGNCYNFASYAHADFLVERGTVSDSGGSSTFPAYRIHEPQHKATAFLASHHALYYRFPTSEDYSIYLFANGLLTKVAEVPAAQANPSTFIPVPATNPVTVSGILGSTTYVIAPSSRRLSVFTELGPGVEGARIATTPFGDILKYRYTIADTPFDTVTGYTAAPGAWQNRYSDKRRFFLIHDGNGSLGAVWQDQDDSSIQLTWFGSDLATPTTVPLPNPASQQLAAAAGDGDGNVFLLTVEPGENPDPNQPRSATLAKADSTGTSLASAPLNTSRNGFNLYEFSDFANSASMTYLNGQLGVILGRTMLQSGDGLNHQGAIGVVFDATTLAVIRNWGQTSGHSFESVLTANRHGEFLGIDLGDNYPRGVHLHKFDATTKRSSVISTFKTQHGTQAASPAGGTYPEYSEISGGGTTYYRWSNDNNTYTELGGVAETALGYTVSFIGEPDPSGHLLDNSRVGTYLNDPRNIGLVTVIENFESAADLDAMVVTSGPQESGGFYTFGGSWSDQRNVGVVWLTDYATTAENASRLKMSPLPDGNLLLLWERWTASNYVSSRAMKVSPSGTILTAETDLGTGLRLNRRDDPVSLGDSVYLVAGSNPEQVLELVVIGGESGSPLDTWREAHFSPADLADSGREATVWGLLADPDHDGSLNLMEYSRGTDPKVAGDGNDGLTIERRNDGSGERLFFVVRQRSAGSDPDLEFVVEVSSDLQSWTPIVTPPTLSGDLGGEFQGFVEATYRDPETTSTHPHRFVRVRVRRN